MATADGMSIPAYEGPLRAAAAGARALLTKAAAGRWDVTVEQCSVSGGMVRHGARTLGFGELAAEAARLTPPDACPCVPPRLRKIRSFIPPVPPPFPRLDTPAKVDGGWMFAGDVRLPDMVYAAIRHAPLGEAAHLAGHDPRAAKGIDGFLRLVEGPDWLAGVATNSWAAEGRWPPWRRVSPCTAPLGGAGRGALDSALKGAIRDGGEHIARTGDADGLLAPKAPYSQRYDIAPAIAAPLETACAVARLRDGLCEIWVATQAPEATRRIVAEALGIAVTSVVLYPMAAGGSFDARLECPMRRRRR
jgi:isoquinoline 1-oxidoreductase beta subunit